MPLRRVSIKPSKPEAMTTVPTATSNLKEELLKWICERHATNGPLDRQLLRDKALGLATSLGVTGFKCSEAWLTVFLKKHGFSPSLTNCSGPTFPDYRVWIDLLRSLITQYRHRDLFNVDELRMYSDFVPARRSSPAAGGHSDRSSTTFADPSSNTNRISMLVCCNSSGTEKLRPVISGPYELDRSGSDCRYERNEDSCITDDLFGDWLAELNEDMSTAGRKILLLLSRDRIRSLRNAPRLSNVNLLFFPKDFPTQLRPLRGDVFHCVKMTHRIRYVERVRSADGEWGPEAIVESVARAWTEVPRELVVSSFQRTKFREDESFLRIECPGWDGLGTGVSFRRFVTFDDDLSDTSASIPEDLKLSGRNDPGEHQYNLRRSRHNNAELVVIDDPPGRKNATKRSAERETGSRPAVASNGHRGASGSRKKLKMVEDVNPEERQSTHQKPSNSMSSNEVGDRSLVERIEDFLESVAGPAVEEDEPASGLPVGRSGEEKNNENVDNLINEMCQRSDNTRGLIERCLRTMTAGNGGNEFTDSAQEVELVPDETGRGEDSRTGRQEEPSMNLFGQACTSGEEPSAAEGTSGCAKTPEVTEFDDAMDGDEEIPIAGRLTLKIIEAIECCEEIERSNDVSHLLQAGDADDEPRTAKRTRNLDDDDDNNDDEGGPAKKRSRPNESWSKRYEKKFVFGPEARDSSSQSAESSLGESPVHGRGPVTKSKKTQTRGGELEKRCIFTLDGNSPGVSYPKD